MESRQAPGTISMAVAAYSVVSGDSARARARVPPSSSMAGVTNSSV